MQANKIRKKRSYVASDDEEARIIKNAHVARKSKSAFIRDRTINKQSNVNKS